MTRQIFFIDDDEKINKLQVKTLTEYLGGFVQPPVEENCEKSQYTDTITTYEMSNAEGIKVHQITVKNFELKKDGKKIISAINDDIAKEDKCVVAVDLCLNGVETTGKEFAFKIAKELASKKVKVQIVSSRLFSLPADKIQEINDKKIIFLCRPVKQTDEGWKFNDQETGMFTAKRILQSGRITIPDTCEDNTLAKKVIDDVKSFNRKNQFFGCILAAVLFQE